MRVRLKFRNIFYPHELQSRDVKLIELLLAASDLFKVDLSNVQLSLNANDYFGIDESDTPISHLGIVSGDIVYVKSLEALDDIARSMELEIANSIHSLYKTLNTVPRTTIFLYAIPVYLCATTKKLKGVRDFIDDLSTSKDITRLHFEYGSTPLTHITFTLYTTGNVFSVAISTKEFDLAKQLSFPIRDHLIASEVTSNRDFVPHPSVVYRHLLLLTNRIKDELIEPILVDVHSLCGLPERLMLSTLPPEVLHRILLWVPLHSLGKLMSCNSELYRHIKSFSAVWRMHLARLNAKKEPLLNAALTRQLHQLRKPSPPALSSPAQPHRIDSDVTASPAPDTKAEEPNNEEDSLAELPEQDTTQSYHRFVARYRSLQMQRRSRGLSPVFI